MSYYDKRSTDCGIYEIRNVANGKRYIGSSCCLSARRDAHFESLRIGKHHSQYLQNSYNKHGRECFQFRVLMRCNKEMLLWYEQRAIDFLKPEYNVSEKAKSGTLPKEMREKVNKVLKESLGFRGMVHNHRRDDLFSVGGIWGGVPGKRSNGKLVDPTPVILPEKKKFKGSTNINLNIALEIHRLNWEEDLSHNRIIKRLNLNIVDTAVSKIILGERWPLAYAIYHWGVDTSSMDTDRSWTSGLSDIEIAMYEKSLGLQSEVDKVDNSENVHGNSKLAKVDIDNIRKLLEDGCYQREIALIYGVSKATICDIKRGKTWKWM